MNFQKVIERPANKSQQKSRLENKAKRDFCILFFFC